MLIKNTLLLVLIMLLIKNLIMFYFQQGSNISLKWAPKFAEIGSTVIDNSSAWRMDNSKKLVIPEINGHLLNKDDRII